MSFISAIGRNRLCLRLGAAVVVLVAMATSAEAERRYFVGYYPSWHSAEAKPLAATSPGYSHVVVAFARPDFLWDGRSWSGTGLQFSQPPNVIHTQIQTLQARGTRVLLAVGGATYLNWTPLAAEQGKPAAITTALTRFVNDMGFDGIDVDFERGGTTPEVIAQYRAAITVLRQAASGKLLSLAAWSTGADCTPATGNGACGGQFSLAGGSAGRERLVLRDTAVLSAIDLVNVMSYDAGVTRYDPVKSWLLYRELFPPRIAVNIGFEVAPEGWGGATLVQTDAAATCQSARIVGDQFGNPVHKAYALRRGLQEGPLMPRPNSNAQDGAMLWHVVKDQKLPTCGHRVVLSPQELEQSASAALGR